MGGLGVKVQHFPLTLLVVLTTLTLPCERDDCDGYVADEQEPARISTATKQTQ